MCIANGSKVNINLAEGDSQHYYESLHMIVTGSKANWMKSYTTGVT